MKNLKNMLLLFIAMSVSLFAQVDYASLNITSSKSKISKFKIISKSVGSTTTIGDYIWFDHNANGIQDLGEAGIYNVEVQLFANATCKGTNIATTASSDIGYYEFTGLPSNNTDTYCIAVVYPSFWTHTTAMVGGSNLDSNVVSMNESMGKIENIFLISNDSYDIGLQHKDENCQIPTLDTDSIGTYDNRKSWIKRASLDVEFEDVVASGYCHEYYEHGPSRGDKYTVHNIDRKGFTENQRGNLSRLFQFMTDPQIISMVRNTFTDGDSEVYFNLISNAFVWYYTDLNSDFSKLESYIDKSAWSKKITNAELASLKNIAKLVFNKVGGLNGEAQYAPMKVYYLWNEDNTSRQDLIVPETLLVPKQEACTIPINNGKLGNFVWFDADKNGKQDVGESGLKDVEVKLYNSTNTLVETTKTDAIGFYNFTGLEADEYTIEFITPSNYSLTITNAQGISNELNSDADRVTGKTVGIILTENSENFNIDAGMYLTSIPSIEIVTSTNNGNVTNIIVGDTITWTYVITNTGNTPLMELVLTDNQVGNVVECTGDGSLALLNPTKSITCTKTGIAILGDYSNVATIEAKDSLGSVVNGTDGSTYTGGTEVVLLANIGDYVWLDSNRNAIQDANELGLSEVSVNLLKENGETFHSTKSDSDGKYEFKDVPAGRYYVQFIVPSSYSVTRKAEGNDSTKDSDADNNGKTSLITLVAGTNNNDVDLGLYPKLANLGDKVWFDQNANGIQDANETQGVENVSVKLYKGNGTLVSETKTVANGQYIFRDLVPEEYYVVFEIPNSYKVSPQAVGNNKSNDSNADTVTGKTESFTLLAGRDDKTIDMGLYQEGTKIGDRVFYDINKNGIQDNGEHGIANVKVSLYGANNNEEVQVVRTSTSGIYVFENVVPGEYYIIFSTPAGYTITDAGKGTPETDSNPDENGKTENFTIESGTQNSTIDMGIYQNLVSFGDRVFLDTNENGLQDLGELGVRDVKVEIVSVNSNFRESMLTDENGNYLFRSLAAGEYSAIFSELPNGYQITQRDANNNANDLNDSDGFFDEGKIITEVALLTPGTNDLSWDLGIFRPVAVAGKAVLGNLVFEDFNKDGVQDIGESGVANVKIDLYNDDTSTKVASTVSDENGFYQFTNIDPNFSYYVQFIVPNGFVVSPQDQDDDTIDSDADASGKTEVLVLEANATNSTVDMGIYREGATIGDRVFFDELNGISNGIQDIGEQGANDVKVTLYDANGVEINSTRTNVSGEYHFTNVPNGQYIIGFSDLPNGYIFTRAKEGNDDEKDSDANANGRTDIIIVNGANNLTSIDAGLRTTNLGISANDIKRGVNGQNVVLDVLANDTVGSYDFDPSTVKITFVPEGATLSENGRLLTVPNEGVWRVDPNSGMITFTPEAGFVGDPTAIEYTVQDTQGNESGANVEINYPPLARDDNVSAEVGKEVVINVLENDSNTSSPLDKSSVRIIDPVTNEEVETLTVAGEGIWSTNMDGSITFTPDANFVGIPTPIEYIVKEIGGDVSNRATITITYPDAVDDVYTIPANGNAEIRIDVPANDSNNTIRNTVTIGCSQPGVKSLVVNGEGNWTVNDDGSITFVPEVGFTGEPTDIEYTIGLVSGGRSNCATVDVRRELLAVDDISTLNVGGVTLINILDNDLGVLNVSSVKLVLPANPVAGSTLTADGKTLTVPGEGVWTVNDKGIVTFTAENGFVAAPTAIRYTVENSNGIVSNLGTITLTQGGLSVVANDDVGQANAGNPVVIDVLANDTGDINRSSLRIIAPNGDEVLELVVPGEGTWTVGNNGTITFVGEVGFVGTPTPIRYIVSNNSTVVLSDTATVTINGVCDCRPYETSIPAMGQLAGLAMILLTLLVSMFFFKEEHALVK